MNENDIVKKAIEGLEKSISQRLMREQRIRLEIFIGEVDLWGARTHLVGRTNVGDNIEVLLRDSWALWNFAGDMGLLTSSGRSKGEQEKRAVRVADIGAGSGFPGVVWKIADPHVDVTLFERKRKTALFLERVISLIDIEGIRVAAEDASERGKPADFDVIVSKAAGRLPSLLPLAERFLRNGGAYVTVKGRGWKEELAGTRLGRMEMKNSRMVEGGRGIMLLFVKR